MTPEQLQAIRERHAENQAYRDEAGSMGEAVWHLLPPLTAERMHADRAALLAEVDRLREENTGLVESLRTQATE